MIRALLLFVVGVQAALGVQTINTCQCGVMGSRDEGSPATPPPGGSEGSWGRADPVQGDRIVNGTRAYRHQFPWQVRVNAMTRVGPGDFELPQPGDYKGTCGGTLINNRYVITAAHCFIETPTRRLLSVEVTLGDLSDENRDEPDEIHMTVPLRDILSHPQYFSNDTHTIFDLALLKLPQALDLAQLDGKISPACLPQNGDDADNKAAIAAGWGRIGENQRNSDVLLWINMTTITDFSCNHQGPSVVCAQPAVMNTNICSGDSGGPLVTKNARDRYVVVGALTASPDCLHSLSTYARITHLLPWIHQNMDQNVVYCS